MHTYIHKDTYTHTSYKHNNTCKNKYIQHNTNQTIHTNKHKHIHIVCMYVYMHVNVCIYMYVYMCVC